MLWAQEPRLLVAFTVVYLPLRSVRLSHVPLLQQRTEPPILCLRARAVGGFRGLEHVALEHFLLTFLKSQSLRHPARAGKSMQDLQACHSRSLRASSGLPVRHVGVPEAPSLALDPFVLEDVAFDPLAELLQLGQALS